MKRWSFYDAQTGIFHRERFGGIRLLEKCVPAGHVAIEGQFDRHCQRFDTETGQVVDYQPPAPSPEHEWTGKRWELKRDLVMREAQRRRAQAGLDAIDLRSIRRLRELSNDPMLKALEVEAEPLRPLAKRSPAKP